MVLSYSKKTKALKYNTNVVTSPHSHGDLSTLHFPPVVRSCALRGIHLSYTLETAQTCQTLQTIFKEATSFYLQFRIKNVTKKEHKKSTSMK